MDGFFCFFYSNGCCSSVALKHQFVQGVDSSFDIVPRGVAQLARHGQGCLWIRATIESMLFALVLESVVEIDGPTFVDGHDSHPETATVTDDLFSIGGLEGTQGLVRKLVFSQSRISKHIPAVANRLQRYG